MSVRVRVDGRDEVIDPAWLEPQDRERIARDGVFLTLDGSPLHGLADAQARAWFARDRETEPGWLGLHADDEGFEREWLIPEIWPYGTFPMLGGAPKIGKTTLVADLVSALTVPGRRFVEHFPPTEYRDLNIWVVNAETPPSDFEAALISAGTPYGEDGPEGLGSLFIDHLELLGGAHRFDLTDKAMYAEWERRLVTCWKCDGSDFWTPDVVVLDGLTAVLLAAGKGLEYVGLWFAAFKRLMRSLGIANALVVGHSTQKGDHLMGGVEALAMPDGLWNYDNGHRLSVKERKGGNLIEPIPIEAGRDGRLRARVGTKAKLTQPAEPPANDEGQELRRAVREFVAVREAEGPPPITREIVSGVQGGGNRVLAEVRRAVSAGELIAQKQPAGTGIAYRIGHVVGEADDGKASK